MNKRTKSVSKPTAAEPLEIASSQAAASASWNVPLAILKASKASGCAAFSPGGRINRQEFFAWLKNHEAEAGQAVALDLEKAERAELEKEKLRAQIRLLRSRDDRENRTLITMAEAVAEWSRALSILEEEYKSLMEPEHFRVAQIRAKSRIGEVLPETPRQS